MTIKREKITRACGKGVIMQKGSARIEHHPIGDGRMSILSDTNKHCADHECAKPYAYGVLHIPANRDIETAHAQYVHLAERWNKRNGSSLDLDIEDFSRLASYEGLRSNECGATLRINVREPRFKDLKQSHDKKELMAEAQGSAKLMAEAQGSAIKTAVTSGVITPFVVASGALSLAFGWEMLVGGLALAVTGLLEGMASTYPGKKEHQTFFCTPAFALPFLATRKAKMTSLRDYEGALEDLENSYTRLEKILGQNKDVSAYKDSNQEIERNFTRLSYRHMLLPLRKGVTLTVSSDNHEECVSRLEEYVR